MSYTVVRADLAADRDTILNFWHNNHRKPLDAKFEWIYKGNPHGRALVWLIKHGPSADCVGMVSVFPRKLSVGGRTILAGIVGDFLIHEAHRTAGPAVMLMRGVRAAVSDSGIDLLYGFPNKRAEPIMKRSGFQRLGGLARLTRVFKTRSLMEKRGVPGVVAGLVSPMADRALGLGWRFLGATACRGLDCREVRGFDHQYSETWRSSRSDGAISVERSPEYLTWKYLKDPGDTNQVFAAFHTPGERLAGYLVCRQDEGSIEIREIAGDIGRIGRCLISNLVGQPGRNTPETIVMTVLENMPFVKVMERLGFRRRSREGSVYWYGTPGGTQGLPPLGDPANWLLVLGDQDT